MTDQQIIPAGALALLTPDEATELADRERVIQNALGTFWRTTALELDAIREKRLYRAMYDSFEAYCESRWGFTAGRARQLIGGAKVAELVETVTGVTLTSEAHARALNPIPAEQRPDVVIDAKKTADSEDRSMTPTDLKMSAASVRAARTSDHVAREAVYAAGIVPVTQKMNLGILKPQKALELVDTLKACKPKVRGDMMMLGITDTTVIRMLNERHKGETYDMIVRSKTLQYDDDRPPVPASQITPQILRDYLDYRAREHRAAGRVLGEARKGVEIVAVDVYRGDPERTAAILRGVLPPHEIVALGKLFSQ